MAVFKQKRVKRIGIGAFVIDSTRRIAKNGQARPRPVRASETDKRLYSELEDFDRQVARVLTVRDAAQRLPRIENLLDEQFRSDTNDAFIRNALLNADSFTSFQSGFKGTLFDDQDRSIGLFPQEPSQATITIQAFIQNVAPLVVTNEFLLTSVSEASQEKYQIFQTFDDDLIYFFDRNPHIYTYGGVLVNAGDIGPSGPDQESTFQWKNRFQALYERILRGSKCVENNARAILTYENVIREGFLLNFSLSEDARNPLNIPFSFTFFVTKESNNHRALQRSNQQQLPADFIGTDTVSPFEDL